MTRNLVSHLRSLRSYEFGHSAATRPIIRIMLKYFISLLTTHAGPDQPEGLDVPASRSILNR